MACRARIEKAQAQASFSQPGNPYDNAQAEAGWRTLKTELLPYSGVFASLEEARLEVAYYLDTYFNLDRRHSTLGYRSPHQFERDFQIRISQCTVCFHSTTSVESCGQLSKTHCLLRYPAKSAPTPVSPRPIRQEKKAARTAGLALS